MESECLQPGGGGPRQFHVLDIRTFPRLARRIEYHQRMAAEIAANPAKALFMRR